MQATRRLAGLALAAVAAVALPITIAQPALAACPSGTYPPSNCTPVLRLTTAAPFTLATANPSWSVRYSGASIAKYQVRYNRAPWNASFQGWVYPTSWQNLHTTSVSQTLPVGYTYCYSARAIDTANRVGAWSAYRCSARPIDDRSVSITSAWTRYTHSNFYLGGYSLTKVHNAHAYRSNAVVGRISVLGATCPSCGVLYVYVGSTRVGTLDFYSSTLMVKQFRTTASFSARKGTIVLVNASTRKRIYLDGLGISRV